MVCSENKSYLIYHNLKFSGNLTNFRGQRLRVHTFFHVCSWEQWYQMGMGGKCIWNNKGESGNSFFFLNSGNNFTEFWYQVHLKKDL